jgi:NAD(P)-dependent dehydrogenase (short-subunit alcohol dehydrogenase family)
VLKGQVAIVTGASLGIGKEIAIKLAEQGMKLSVIRSSEDIHKSADDIKRKGFADVLPIQADISNESQVKEAVERTLQEYKQIDLPVNNAGVGFFKQVDETTLEEWK